MIIKYIDLSCIYSNKAPLPLIRMLIAPFIIYILILLPAPLKSQTIKTRSEGIVAVVNTDIITQFELNNRMKFIIFSTGLQNKKIDAQKLSARVLRALIDDKLKLQEAARLGIKVGLIELKTGINKIEKMNRLAPGRMHKILAKKNIDFNTFEIRIKADIAWRKAVLQKLRYSYKVSDSLIDQTIAEIDKNKGKPEYGIAEIYIPFNPTLSLQDQYQSGERIFSQLERGASFASLARSFSQSASAIKGGNLGWVRINQIDPALSGIVMNMKKGTISKPVKGTNGYYILHLHDKRISSSLPSSGGKISIQQIFFPKVINSSTTEFNTKKKLAKIISSSVNTCPKLEKIGSTIGSKESGLIELTDTSQLPINIQTIVQNLPLSKASEPIQINDGYLILMVCKRTTATFSKKVRASITNMLLEKQADLLAQRMLRNLRRLAFIDIRR
jgi:peptidyl-prolyl cis-trans isomerase SurA